MLANKLEQENAWIKLCLAYLLPKYKQIRKIEFYWDKKGEICYLKLLYANKEPDLIIT